MIDEDGFYICEFCDGETGQFNIDTGNHSACDEIAKLRARVNELEQAQEWIKYIEGDESTYPKEDGALYDILCGFALYNAQEFYHFENGWASGDNIRYYRPLPPAPKEGEG